VASATDLSAAAAAVVVMAAAVTAVVVIVVVVIAVEGVDLSTVQGSPVHPK
jgi:hypothetical protein